MPKCKICGNTQTEYFYKIQKYLYYRCSNCTTLFLYPALTTSQTSHYYSKDFKFTAGRANEVIIRKRSRKIISTLLSLNPNGKTLLDVGSGYGYFIHEAEKMDLHPIGIEPAGVLYHASIKRLIEAEVKNISFEQYYKNNKQKKFDFVTLIHTIEHVIDPKITITNAIKLLNPGGILYIETPNLKSHLFKAEKQKYTFLTPPNHLWIFSLNSLQTMLNNNQQITISNVSTYSYPEHFMGIIKKYVKSKVKDSNVILKQSAEKQNEKAESQKKLKYLLFDKIFSPMFYRLLNIGNYGSILELYLKKK